MKDLELREQEIFKALKELINLNFVIIGGYGVNSYTLPRFSVDCDLVVKDEIESEKIGKILNKLGYKEEAKSNADTPYHGEFIRFEKKIEKDFKVSFDILIGKVLDRQTGAHTSAEWIFDNSTIRELKGKTFKEKLEAKIPSAEALLVMKFISCRNTDIRDIFMLITHINNFKFVKDEVSERTDFEKQFKTLKDTVYSKGFKDNLQGVFGFVQEETFEKHKKLILKLEK